MVIAIVIFGLFMVFGLALTWFVGPPDWYAPRDPQLPCPVCGARDRNCEGRMTSDCRPARQQTS